MTGAHDYGGYRKSGAGGVPDHLLPRLVETSWACLLPAPLDRASVGFYEEFGSPPVAVIWYREESDTVVVHRSDSLAGPLRQRVDERVRALRIQIARS